MLAQYAGIDAIQRALYPEKAFVGCSAQPCPVFLTLATTNNNEVSFDNSNDSRHRDDHKPPADAATETSTTGHLIEFFKMEHLLKPLQQEPVALIDARNGLHFPCHQHLAPPTPSHKQLMHRTSLYCPPKQQHVMICGHCGDMRNDSLVKHFMSYIPGNALNTTRIKGS